MNITAVARALGLTVGSRLQVAESLLELQEGLACLLLRLHLCAGSTEGKRKRRLTDRHTHHLRGSTPIQEQEASQVQTNLHRNHTTRGQVAEPDGMEVIAVQVNPGALLGADIGMDSAG